VRKLQHDNCNLIGHVACRCMGYATISSTFGKLLLLFIFRYHSDHDKRLPTKFICFHCSLRKDKNWEIIKVQTWYEELLGNFSRLVLFRLVVKALPSALLTVAAVLSKLRRSINLTLRVPLQNLLVRMSIKGWTVISRTNCRMRAYRGSTIVQAASS
jgi:hypothetical protein